MAAGMSGYMVRNSGMNLAISGASSPSECRNASRGARRALLQLKRDMAAGQPAAFTIDGPRGPAQVAQPGAVWLAKVTGNPVVPFHIEASRHWTLRNWDRTQIPKPFANVAIAIGETAHQNENATLIAFVSHECEGRSGLDKIESPT